MANIEVPTVETVPPARRVIAAFSSPTTLFGDITRNTSWWPAFLVLVLVSVAFSSAVQKQVGWAKAYDAILHQSPKSEQQLAQLPPDQLAQRKSIGAKITQGTAFGTPVIILLVTAVVAGVLLGTLNFGFGGAARFGELFAVYLYASLPLALKSLLAIVALYAGLDSGSFLITNPVGSNLGYYLAPDTAPWMMALATSFDIFTFWMLALLILGCAIVARVSRTSAAIAVLGWWVLMLILKVGGAVLQS